jgi:hypothetical protein
MLEADHQFRRVNGRMRLPKLRAALEAHFTKAVTAASQNEDDHGAATEVQRNPGQPPSRA